MRRQISRWARFALVIAVLAVVVATVFALSTQPGLPVVPVRALPVPNAYDYYVRASILMDDTAAVDTAYLPHLLRGYSKPTAADIAYSVKGNLPVLAELHDGFKYPFLWPRDVMLGSPWRRLTTNYRSLSRVIAFEGRAAAARGDWDTGIADGIDLVQMGTAMQSGADMYESFDGYVSESIGRDFAWPMVAHIGSAAAKREAIRVYRLSQDQGAMPDIVVNEKWSHILDLQREFRNPHWRDDYDPALVAGASGAPAPSPLSEAGSKLRLLLLTPRAVLINYSTYMSAVIAEYKLPYAKLISATPPPPPGDPLSRMAANDQKNWDLPINYEGTIALDEMLAAELGLRAYYLDHHRNPASLAALVPAYLPAVPFDPFSPGRPLVYRPSGSSSYILYSVGPDMVDDGGTPMSTIFSRYRQFRLPYISAPVPKTGDIVAGVN